MAKKKGFSVNKKTIGIILLIALVLLYVPIPLIDGKVIAAILILLTALYNIFM